MIHNDGRKEQEQEQDQEQDRKGKILPQESSFL
jgi:hypothetical protein